MRAMVLDQERRPLRGAELERPMPGPGQLVIRVHACAVCRTDLHVVDGELPEPKPHLVPGHEIVGTVIETGSGVDRVPLAEPVAAPCLRCTSASSLYSPSPP